MLHKLSLSDLDIKGKRVFMRVDFNVPLDKNLQITDDSRIVAALPSIQFALENGASVILASHLGRPKGEVKPEMSLKPAAERLSQLLKADVVMAPDCVGPEVEELASRQKPGDVLLLENLRFHQGETKNDPAFSESLSKLADVYVNDAFGTAHRAHASTEGITKHFKIAAAGFLVEKEIEYFSRTLANPAKPFMAILGGAKISGKIPVIENLIGKVDTLLIGGGMAFTFFKAMGMEIGNSLLEEDMVEKAVTYIEEAKRLGMKMLLPEDIVIAEAFDNESNRKIVAYDEILPGWMGLDIGPKTILKWSHEIANAKTIVWNGPMGAFEMSNFAVGTVSIARHIANSDAISIIGGGDSSAALDLANVRYHISHISTGGGASLDFLAGKDLPGISALTDK